MAKRHPPANIPPENRKEEEEVAKAAEFLVWMSGATLEKEDAVKVEDVRRRVVGREMLTEIVVEESVGTSIDGSVLHRYPPIRFLDGKIDLTACSVPFEKQLTPSDVKEEQNRLSLNKDEVIRSILPLLHPHEDPLRGIPVRTYNPAGKEYEMMFKSWSDNKFYVLNGGWKSFFRENELTEYRHWVTVWMFRHSQTRKLCFALTWKVMPIDGPRPRPKTQKRIKTEREENPEVGFFL